MNTTVSAEEHDKFIVFQDWLIENGAKMPKLELKVSLDLLIH
jgi:hypothetical protein